MIGGQEFEEFFARATHGRRPYAYQTRVGLDGLPETLDVPTGTGKTAAVVLGWLYRRRFHPDPEVRAGTPHWLVYVLPMRVLTEQVIKATESWLASLDLHEDTTVYPVRGGEGPVKSEWRRRPEKDAIFVGTLDMVTSRQLNRGYGEGRRAWPIDFGLFNNGCHFVYDEVQLMGPALPTSRQLHGLRIKLGMAKPSSATWMSATIDPRGMGTIDAPPVSHQISLDAEDRRGDLATRLEARRCIEQLVTADGKLSDVAKTLSMRHRPGTLTLAILNTVERARETFKELGKLNIGVESVLLHSRFRPVDRAAAVDRALAPVDTNGPGRIVISTQVVEAGVDISASLMLTEAAPWSSIVQRVGRCNRDGLAWDATVIWLEPAKPLPYELDDISASVATLRELEGQQVTSEELGRQAVTMTQAIHPVLRRVDLIGLFDTLPDLSGNDVDVSRFIRKSDDLDVEIAWWDSELTTPINTETPGAAERCPVPVAEIRKFLKAGKRAWRFEQLSDVWVRCFEREIRPGMVLVIPASEGGYTSSAGWDPKSRIPVVPVSTVEPSLMESLEAVSDDHASVGMGRWITLQQHLEDVEREVRRLSAKFEPLGLTAGQTEAAAVAGKLHDIGKAHSSFQDFLLSTEPDRRTQLEAGGPWAKSASGKGGRKDRSYFRHELVSALVLLDPGNGVLGDVEEPDLVRYLVASHHGVVRLGFRPMPNEQPLPDGTLVALGVHDREIVGSIRIPGGEIPESMMRLSVIGLGASADGPSWSRRMLALRDREDLGPFRLAFLEALVRLADWRASASYQDVTNA